MKDDLTEHRNGSSSSSSVVPIATSAIAIAVGCLVLVGWAFDIDFLKRVIPDAKAMNPISAFSFILLGVSLWLLRSEEIDRRLRRIAQGCALVVVLVGLIKLIQILLGWPSGIDQLLFPAKLEREAAIAGAPNQMAPNTAFNFFLLGFATLLLDLRTRHGRWPAQYLGVVAFLVSLLAFLGYLYGVKSFYAVLAYVPMSVHTALTFVLLSVGIICARPDHGLMAVISGGGMGGVVARRLLPAAILVPTVLGWLRIEGQRAGLYGTAFGTSLFVVTTAAILSALVWWSALQLRRTDIRREQAEKELLQSERQHRIIITNLPDAALIMFDHDLRYTLVEGPAMWRLGWKKEEIEGKTIHEFTPPERVASLEPMLRKTLAGERQSFEWHTMRGNRIFSVDVVPLDDTNGKFTTGLMVARDITERRRTEEELRKADERFRLLVEGVQEYAILMLDPQGHIASWNTGAERINGWRAEEIIGEHFSIFYTREDIERSHPQEELRRAAANGRYEEEGLRVRKDGSHFWASVLITALKDKKGNVLGFSKVTRDITERKRAEEALRKSEARIRAIVQTASDAIVTMTTDGLIRSFNGGAEHIFGYTAEEVLGQPLKMLMPERLGELHEAGFRRYLKSGETHVIGKGAVELVGRRKSGKEFPLELSLGQMREDEGTLFTGIIRDITERKRTEEELREAEERFRSAFDNAAIGMSLNEPGGRFVQVNPALCEMLGRSEEEMLNTTFQEITHSDDLDVSVAQVRRVLDGEIQHYELEKRYLHADGHTVWISMSVSTLKNAEGHPVYLVAQMQDITERVRAEEKLLDTTVLQQAILDNASHIIISTGPGGTIRTFNEAAHLWLGYTSDEVVGKSTLVLIHDPSEVECRAEELSKQLGEKIEPGFDALAAKASRGEPDENEWMYIRKDGSRFPVLLSMTALRDADDNITGFVSIASDITERKQAEEKLRAFTSELQRSNQELQEFASVASHDLQEPLRKVRAFGDRLSTNYSGELSPRAQDYLQRMQSAAERMQNLINDLLTYSRVTTRARPFVEVDLLQVTHEVLSDLETRIERSEGRVEVGNLPTVEGDPTQMRQVMQNLISNALKFHREGEPPVVRIRSRIENGICEVSVEDRGIGFEEKYVDRIFGIFERLHGRQEYEGTGVGLAVCKKIVERHGGVMTAKSRPGRGTTFVFTLPVKHEGGTDE